MIIGIVTLPFHINYGGILQGYALQTVLERMGHDVYFVHRREPAGNKLLRIKNIFKHIIVILAKIKIKTTIAVKIYERRNFEQFIRSNIHKQYYNNAKTNIKLNVLISGSDQVWRDWGEGKNLMFYFLDFARKWNIKRYAYAASFGGDKWLFNEKQSEEVIDLLRSFDKISVRENDAVALLKEHANLDALWLLDPTLLLSAEDYQKELKVTSSQKNKFVTYILDNEPNKQNVINKIEETSGIKHFDIGTPVPSVINGITELPTIESWLGNFMGAELVVTDSFHGTAFSINFNKNFVVLSNHLRGQSRLLSILSMFGLENRLATNPEDAVKILKIPIDWNIVNERLVREREKSYNFLRNI
jgi:hypothetical protein